MTPVATLHASPETATVVVRPKYEARPVAALLDERLPAAKRSRQGRSLVLDSFEAARILEWRDRFELFDWRDGVERMLSNRRRLLENWATVADSIAEIKSQGVAHARALLAEHQALDVLDDHQWVNVAAATVPNGWGLCLFDEQGAGKTVTVVHVIDLLATRREAMTALVVAPKSMIPEWERDIRRFMGDLYDVQPLVGPRRRRLEILAGNPDIVVCNYEGVVSLEPELRSYLGRFGGRVLLVVDESFNVKNRDARRTQAMRRIREQFDRALVLCGTPAPNAPSDVVAQFDLVDFGWTFRGLDIPDDRDLAVPVVRTAMERRGLYTRHLKADVLPELPSKTFHRVVVPFAPQQGAAYRAALDDLVLDLRGIDEQEFAQNIGHYLARRATLLRVCSDPAGVVPGYQETPAKFEALDELLVDWIGNRGEKVVLWSFYRSTLTALVRRFERFNPVRYDGSVSSVDERRDAVRRFQDDDDTMLFVGNAGAAGAGLTLHRARLAVYESMSNQAAHFLQSIDRIHRRGQEQEVEYAVLLCEGSLEEGEFERLLTKESRSRDLLGDPGGAPLTRNSMLTELATSARRLDVSTTQ